MFNLGSIFNMVLIYKEMKLINCYHDSYHKCMRKVQRTANT